MQKRSLINKSHLNTEIQSKKTRSTDAKPAVQDKRQKHCVCHTAAPAVEQHGSPSIWHWDRGLRVPGRAGCSSGAQPPAWPGPSLPGPAAAAAALCLGSSDDTASMGLSAESPSSPPQLGLCRRRGSGLPQRLTQEWYSQHDL